MQTVHNMWIKTLIEVQAFVQVKFQVAEPCVKLNDQVHWTDSNSPTWDACRWQTQLLFDKKDWETSHTLKSTWFNSVQ